LPPIARAGGYEVWPCNIESFNAYRAIATQWRKDANGLEYALDYVAVLADLRELVDDAAARREIYADIKCMERAAVPVHQKHMREAIERMQQDADIKRKLGK
jgi:hypothetical protein